MATEKEKVKIKSLVLVCDFDGTLVAFPAYRFLKSNFLRLILTRLVEIFCSLASRIQNRFAKPTKYLKIVKKYQKAGIKIFIVTARKETKSSRQCLESLLKTLGLELNPKNILMRAKSCSVEAHKKIAVSKIAKKYHIIGILEDEKKFHSELKQFGPIIRL